MSHTPAHQLDDELWQSILCQLTLVDTLNFSRTCKRFWSVAQEDAVWHCLYSTEFGACPPLQQNKRWKTIFKRRCGLPVTAARVLEHLFDIRKLFLNSSMQCRAQEDRVRLRKKRQARILHLQNQAQVTEIQALQTSSASLCHAKADLAKQRQKLRIYRTELQVLQQLRYLLHCSHLLACLAS